MSKNKKCRVMVGPLKNEDWALRHIGLVSVAFRVVDDYDGICNFDIEASLQRKAEKIGANLVTDVTLAPAPLGGDSDCYMVAMGNAYYAPELEPDYISEAGSSE